MRCGVQVTDVLPPVIIEMHFHVANAVGELQLAGREFVDLLIGLLQEQSNLLQRLVGLLQLTLAFGFKCQHPVGKLLCLRWWQNHETPTSLWPPF